MQQDGQDREAVGPVDEVLLGSGHALDHRVDGLEVRRVGGELEGDLVAGAADERARLAQVVLHVARALDGLGVDVPLELLEDLVVALAHDVGEHVEAAPMGHAHHRAVEAGVGGALEHRVDERDRALRAFDAEALLADVLLAEELLEGLGGVELFEDVALVVGGQVDADALHLLLHPVLLLRLLDVHVLDADRAAVGVAQDVEDLSECQGVGAGQALGEELAVQVPDREAVGGRVELRVHVRLFPGQRVEIGDEVAPHPVHVDDRVDLHLLLEQGLLPVAGVDVAPPLHGLVGHADRAEHVDVEVVLAEQ